jgi:hypothetical protein
MTFDRGGAVLAHALGGRLLLNNELTDFAWKSLAMVLALAGNAVAGSAPTRSSMIADHAIRQRWCWIDDVDRLAWWKLFQPTWPNRLLLVLIGGMTARDVGCKPYRSR